MDYAKTLIEFQISSIGNNNLEPVFTTDK